MSVKCLLLVPVKLFFPILLTKLAKMAGVMYDASYHNYSIQSTWWLHRLASDVPSITCAINSQSISLYNLDLSNFLLEFGLWYFWYLCICLLLVFAVCVLFGSMLIFFVAKYFSYHKVIQRNCSLLVYVVCVCVYVCVWVCVCVIWKHVVTLEFRISLQMNSQFASRNIQKSAKFLLNYPVSNRNWRSHAKVLCTFLLLIVQRTDLYFDITQFVLADIMEWTVLLKSEIWIKKKFSFMLCSLPNIIRLNSIRYYPIRMNITKHFISDRKVISV